MQFWSFLDFVESNKNIGCTSDSCWMFDRCFIGMQICDTMQIGDTPPLVVILNLAFFRILRRQIASPAMFVLQGTPTLCRPIEKNLQCFQTIANHEVHVVLLSHLTRRKSSNKESSSDSMDANWSWLGGTNSLGPTWLGGTKSRGAS